jgi:hypothetical protein
MNKFTVHFRYRVRLGVAVLLLAALAAVAALSAFLFRRLWFSVSILLRLVLVYATGSFKESYVLVQKASRTLAVEMPAAATELGETLNSVPESLWFSYPKYLPKSAVDLPFVFSDNSNLDLQHRQPSLPFISGAQLWYWVSPAICLI